MIDRLALVLASRWTRLVLVMLLVLAFQTTLFNDVRPFGFAIQIVAIFVACAGVVHGPEIGAIVGLVSGIMYDAVLAPPLGVSAIVLAIVGVTGALLLRPFRDPPWWLKVLMASVAAGSGELFLPVVKAVIGLDGWLDWRVAGAMAVTFTASLLFAAGMMPVSRWTLRERITFGS